MDSCIDGGSIGLLPLDKTGKGCANETRVFQAHGGASITDWEFSPFHENLLATGAEDGMVRSYVVGYGRKCVYQLAIVL